ncbi:galactose ABC transporter substrate-binding protein [Pseudoflavonifractor sp. MSJ-37]|uniref:galactose ABC transporter substrate-binding protein n=1 Tax=Pseudoflavonifractor sp. MSJ-37 TaxID=2841531 RepID=UPI001C0FA662|nr:galactose ABC transporter substrate-binding protein [Pseudoflavonifractor sp. MSJ-37]MBU5436305.1 galactose ABC transporter substrate-binding protein [Pseudoflavonifractor sp. MSJ-37]
MNKKIPALALALTMTASLAACGGNNGGTASTPAPAGSTAPAGQQSDLKVGVFYYNFADAYISTVRSAMDAQLDGLGVTYQNFDAQTNQGEQTNQVNTAITDGYNLLIVNVVENASPDAAQNMADAAKAAGIPIIFFNRDFDASVIQSYDQSAFVGTDPAEAGHMQGQAIGEYLVENYDAVDLNGDGKISYVMFKGQEGNPEAEMRTQYGVEDANTVLEAAGKPDLEFYDAQNEKKYLVDQTGAWSSQAATDYMNTILGQYNDGNNNMVELVIANNDGMAEGAISALQQAGYNQPGSDKVIPVYGVDAMASAVEKIDEGIMAGTVKQDGEAMAATIATLVQNVKDGAALMDNTDQYVVDSDAAKIRVPYAMYTK